MPCLQFNNRSLAKVSMDYLLPDFQFSWCDRLTRVSSFRNQRQALIDGRRLTTAREFTPFSHCVWQAPAGEMSVEDAIAALHRVVEGAHGTELKRRHSTGRHL